jgi:hypothetical protein
MDDGTLEALDGLGEVTWLIAPNRLHGAFFEAARRRFPRARVLSCRDGEGDRLAGEGSLGGIADYHVVRGSRRFSEIVLYHDAAETLMLSDLILNVSSAEPRLKWLLKLNGAWAQPAQGRVQRWGYLRDRRALSVFYRWAMARPFRQISVSHGGIIRDGAREVIYRLFRPTVSASLRQSR